jgi:outer membrane protein TolC
VRGIVFLLFAIFLDAKDFESILKGVDKSTLLEAKEYEVRAKKALVDEAKAEDIPHINASLEAIRLKETPTLYLKTNQGTISLPMGSKSRYEGEITISYPIFSGFAIKNLIEKKQIEAIRAKLLKKDIKRELYLKASTLYGEIYSLNSYIKALKEAKRALELSYIKSQNFYKQGLIPLSDLYNIEAKKYDIEAQIEQIRVKKASVVANLKYLSSLEVEDATIKDIFLPKNLNIEQREDILALKKELLIYKKDIDLAKSKMYPNVGLKASLKRFGDSLELNSDGYTNADESYIGVRAEYNLYRGGGDKKRVEAAKFRYLAKKSFVNDYINRVEIEFDTNKKILLSLLAKLTAAKKRVDAANSYYKQILGRYNHQLASADELSRSVASLADAKAKKKKIESEIFIQKCKILLLSSLKNFQNTLLK